MMRRAVVIVLLTCFAATATACTSFLLEDGDDLYFVHSLNQGSVPAVDGAAYLNPRGARKDGYSFAALFDPEDDSGPELFWRSRYGSVTFSPLGKEMPDGGLNEAGLFIWEMGFDTEYPVDETVPTLFQMQWMQYQLDNYTTVDEVLDNLHRVTLDGWGWHYFVADTAGRTAIIDFPDGRPEIFTGPAMPVPVCGNSYYPEAMRWLTEHEGFGGDLPYRQEFSEIPRFITGVKRLQEFDGADPVPFCFETLQAMSVNVRWSVVFDVTRGTAHFNTNLDHGIRSFAFGPEDYAEGRETMMLDMNTPGPGDVKDRFVPFTLAADEVYMEQILGMLFDDATDIPALAKRMVGRMNIPRPVVAEGVVGPWHGTLTVPQGDGFHELPLTLLLNEDDGVLCGSLECSDLGAAMPLVNPRFHGGLLAFVTDMPDGSDRLDFRLHLGTDGLTGSAGTWDWENRRRAVVKLERSR
ncbi:MAG: hypothetical protein GY838_14225 [bacterium]|nr:hypothetical protein [bacterium]